MTKKEMGEFEARPEVKPAVAVPIERRRPTGLICSVVILAILVAGLAGYIVFDLTSRANSGDKTKCVTTSTEKNVEGEKEGEQGEIANNSARRLGFVMNHSEGNYYVTKSGDVYYEPVVPTFMIDFKNLKEIKFKDGKEPGVFGTYTLNRTDDLNGYCPVPCEKDEISFKGYKLDLHNILFADFIEWGQQYNGALAVFVDTDGNASFLRIGGVYEEKWSAKLFKDVEKYKDLMNVTETNEGNGIDSVLTLKGGVQYNAFEIIEAGEFNL